MTQDWPRLFSVELYPEATVEVQSLAGHPSALQENPCGHGDGQPATEARFNVPQGIGLYVNASLTDKETLYIADTLNNRIRGVSAGCAFLCENGGTCVAPDQCRCAPGWEGHDCTRPICSSPCDWQKEVCVGPDQCGCLPGYGGVCVCVRARVRVFVRVFGP